jgi:hypothetical protein
VLAGWPTRWSAAAGFDLVEPAEALDQDAVASGGAEREVRAELIHQILLDGFGRPDGVRPDPRGIWLRGARPVGALDLAEDGRPCRWRRSTATPTRSLD